MIRVSLNVIDSIRVERRIANSPVHNETCRVIRFAPSQMHNISN